MRRPRSKLEVSTFPFLAVLLCVMGSLLLLLFIMDRRAKIAAQYRVAQEVEKRKSRTKEEEEARQAEWEKAKEQLHISLLEQQAKLLAEENGFKDNLDETSKKLAGVKSRNGELETKVKGEAAKISLLQLTIENHKAGLQQVAQKETMSKADLLAAAKELAELEAAFRQLRALRERDKQTFSVVPYRGKRGDFRPPIYVECVQDGVIFHPEKKPLDRWDFTPGAVRMEVERRHGPLAVQKAKPAANEPRGPYVLFLIRPDGIGSYYKAQAALKGYQLDFGYELIDDGWVLDFGGGNYATGAPPSNAPKVAIPAFTPGAPVFGKATGSQGGSPIAQGSAPGKLGPPPSANGFGNGGGSPFPPQPTGSAVRFPGAGDGDNGNPGTGPYAVARPGYTGNQSTTGLPGYPGNGFGPGGNVGGSGSGIPSLAPPATGTNSGLSGASGTGPGVGGDKRNFGPGNNSAAQPGSTGNSPGTGTDNGSQNKNPSFVQIAKNSAMGPTASAGLRPDPITGLGNPNATGQTASLSLGTPNATGQPANTAGGNKAGNHNGSGGSEPNLNPNATPIPGNSVAGQRPGAEANGTSNGTAGSPNGSGGSPGGSDGSAGEASNDPLAKSLPGFGADKSKRPPPAPPLSKMLGNKDFIITIDCHGDYVTVTPGNMTYAWTSSNLKATDDALTRTVSNLITRRQAGVRQGEPPYRPLIRFQVRPEGLRTYYHVYPLFDSLGVARMRENAAQ